MHSVTGVITTFGRNVNVVEKAIVSMESQTYQMHEIILVDDNQNNSPLCIELKKMCSIHPMVKYVKQDGNKGACAARNLGIENASGEFIGFLDDDDEWLPEKIETQINAFDSCDTSLGLVSVSGYIFDEKTGAKSNYFNYDSFKSDPSFEDMLFRDWVGSTSQPLIRSLCFNKVGMFSLDQPARQDYEMWIRISRDFKIKCIRDRLFIHYYHDGEQISKNTEKAQKGYMNIYEWYRKDYKKNPAAEIEITRNIVGKRGNKSRFRYLKYYVIRIINSIKLLFGRR